MKQRMLNDVVLEQNAALLYSRTKTEQLFNPNDCPKKKPEGKLELWNSQSKFSTRKDTLIYKKNQEIYEIMQT